jgi:hypothetical protein
MKERRFTVKKKLSLGNNFETRVELGSDVINIV